MVIVELVFGIAPEALDAVDVVVSPVSQGLAVVDPVVFAKLFEGIVAFKGVGVEDAAFPGFAPDDLHEVRRREGRDHPGVHLAAALQKTQNDAFPGGAPAFLAFAPAAKVGIVNFYLSREPFAFQFTLVVEALPDLLVDRGDGVVGKRQLPGKLESRALVNKTQDHPQLPPESFKRFALAAPATLEVSSSCLVDPSGEAENTRSPEPKGRQTLLRTKIDHNSGII